MINLFPTFRKYIFGYGSRLRNKITLFFVLLASIPVLILSVFSVYLINLSHRYDISALEMQTLSQKNEEIGKFFSDALGVLELHVGYDRKDEIEKSQAIATLQKILKDNPSFVEVGFIDIRGRELQKVTRDSNAPELFNVQKLPRYYVPLSGKNYIGDAHHTLDGLAVTIASPVYNSSNEIIEIIAAEVSLSKIVQSVQNTTIGATGRIMLLDKTGRVLVAPSSSSLKEGDDLSGYVRVRNILKGFESNGLAAEDVYQGYSVDAPVVGSGVRAKDVDWLLLAEWPLKDANAIADDIRSQALYFTLICIVVVLLVAPIFSYQLTSPIEKLQAGTKEVEKGNFDVDVTITSHDELEELGRSFGSMMQGLKRLQELRNEFVYIITHELRSPVTAIRGYISLMNSGEGGEVAPKMKELLVPLSESSEHLSALINDLLEVAKSEAGHLEVKSETVTLGKVVEEALSEIRSLAVPKKITLEYAQIQQTTLGGTPGESIPTENVRVMGDSMRIKQVMVNLVSNAIKYGKEGGFVKITHEVKGGMVLTHVADNGQGMPEKDQEHLFEKFYRSERVGKIIGTGLGLFITKELVEKMGGTLTCVSIVDEGTTFTVGLKKVG